MKYNDIILFIQVKILIYDLLYEYNLKKKNKHKYEIYNYAN